MPTKPKPKKPVDDRGRAPSAPPVRTFRVWTVDLLRSAEAQADAGNLYRAAEVTEQLLGDDRIGGLVQTRTLALFGLAPTFEPADDSEAAKGQADLLMLGDWWALCSEADAAKFLAWGIVLGLAPGCLDWFDEQGKPYQRDGRDIPRLRFRHPKHLRQDATTGGWLLMCADGREVPFTPGDGQWVAFMPYGSDRPAMSGAWRGLARWWLLKQYAREDWGEYSEQGKQKFAKADKDASFTAEDRKKLALDIAAMASNATIALPPGVDLDMLEVSANTEQIYNAQINAANMAAAIRLTGHNLTSQVDGGSFAAAQVGEGILIDYRRFDAGGWSTWMHDDIWRHIVRVNTGDDALTPWVKYPVEPPVDRKAVADELDVTVGALSKLGTLPGYIDVKALLTERKIPFDEAKLDEVLAAPTTTRRTDIFKYHLDYGVLTINEIRGALGFDPTPGGDVPPTPVAQPAGGSSTEASQALDGVTTLADTPADRGQEQEPLTPAAEGMGWTDAVAGEAARQVQPVVNEVLVRVLDAIESARSFDDLKARLVALAGGKPDAQLQKLITRALILSQGRGAVSVTEEP